MGIEKDSLLEWTRRTDFKVDHVVLGKGQPGGAWTVRGNSEYYGIQNQISEGNEYVLIWGIIYSINGNKLKLKVDRIGDLNCVCVVSL